MTLRLDEARVADDEQLLLRLGTDSDVDQTIKASLGHCFSYARVLHAPGLPGDGALTLSVYLLADDQAPEDFRVAPFQRAYRTTTTGRMRARPVRRSGPPT